MAAGNLVIDRLHVLAHGGRNPVALKLSLQQALQQVRLQSAHLPPQAILVIRRLESGPSFGLAAGEMRRWQRGVEAQLDDLAGRALRPGRQYISPQANSVLFEDEVDLLLCYTRDLLAGRSAWYWAELFPADSYPGQPASQRLLTAWQTYSQAIPHTMVALQPREATAALGHMNRNQLSRLAHSLHDTFALPRGALDATGSEPAQVGLAGWPTDPPGQAMALDPAVLNRFTAAPPWREWLPPHQYQELAPQAVYLLGLSYTLVKRPQQARQQAFAQQARRWLEQAAARHEPTPPSPAGKFLSEPHSRPAADIQTGPTGEPAGETQADTPMADNTVNAGTLAEDSVLSGTTVDDGFTSSTAEASAFSRLGGAFFFINLMTWLRLSQTIPDLAGLNPWELLGGLTATLLGRRLAQFQADPLWGIINELAGLEPGQPWGASLSAPGNFLLPAAWLAKLPPVTIAAHYDPAGSRLRVWAMNPDYLIADLATDAAPEDWTDLIQNSEEWTNLTQNANLFQGDVLENRSDLTVDAEDRSMRVDQLLSPSLAWWVRRLRPYLSQFLIHLTGNPIDPIDTLFHRPATLYLSRTHVDLVLSMEQISIPLRRAGLDQTPGWRPEFGYIVSIHFE